MPLPKMPSIKSLRSTTSAPTDDVLPMEVPVVHVQSKQSSMRDAFPSFTLPRSQSLSSSLSRGRSQSRDKGKRVLGRSRTPVKREVHCNLKLPNIENKTMEIVILVLIVLDFLCSCMLPEQSNNKCLVLLIDTSL